MIKLIVAMTKEGIIGNNNNLPWYIPEELKHFKETTLNHSLLFGRKTFEYLPKTLKQRQIFVLSTSLKSKDAVIVKNEEELMRLFKKFENSKETLFISGGKSIYEKYYKHAKELIITIIKKKYIGDTKIILDLENYEKKIIKQSVSFDVYLYKKIN